MPKDKCQAKVKTMAKAWPLHRCSIYNTVLHSTVPLTRSVDSSHETTLVFPFWVGGTQLLLSFPRQSSSVLSIKREMSHSFCVTSKILVGSCGRWPALMQGVRVVLCRPMWAPSPSALRPSFPHRLSCPARIAFCLLVVPAVMLRTHSTLFLSSQVEWHVMSMEEPPTGVHLRRLLKDPPRVGVSCSLRGPLWPCVHSCWVFRQWYCRGKGSVE